jgi:hypothetical protein
MSTLVHADIFFLVTTIVVVIVGIALTIALIYLAKVLSDIKLITGQVKEETILFRQDIGELRNDIKREGFRAERFFMFFRNFFKRTEVVTKARSKKKNEATK